MWLRQPAKSSSALPDLRERGCNEASEHPRVKRMTGNVGIGTVAGQHIPQGKLAAPLPHGESLFGEQDTQPGASPQLVERALVCLPCAKQELTDPVVSRNASAQRRVVVGKGVF